jgi:hypothetical protein
MKDAGRVADPAEDEAPDAPAAAPSTSADAAPTARLPRTAPRRAINGRSARRATGGNARPSRVPFALLISGLLAGGLSLLLGLNTMSAANELRRHALSQRDFAVAAEVQQLQDEVAASGAPGNLARAAESLGMVPADNPAFLVIGPDGSVQVLGDAAPATAAPLPTQPAPKPKPKPTDKPKKGEKDRHPGSRTTRTSAKTSHPASPTPTPTPTLTLPGGAR